MGLNQIKTVASYCVVFMFLGSGALAAGIAEEIPPGEAALTDALIAQIRASIQGVRDAHPKAHGCVDEATVEVLDSADRDLQVGLLANPGTQYPALVRFSSGSSNPKAPDTEPGGHGLALKILLPDSVQTAVADIPGEKYFVDEKYYKTWDVIGISGLDEFMVEAVADYPEFFKASALAAAIRDPALSPSEVAMAKFKAMDDHYLHLNGQAGKSRPREARLIQQFGAHRVFDLTDVAYQSWVPYKMGGSAAVKYQIRPCSVGAPATGPGVGPDFLRERLKKSLRDGELCFELAAQKHLPGFPSVEDAVAPWPRDESPYVAVAKITIAQKQAGRELVSEAFCETLSFNPGHATADHFPLGGIGRSRVKIYAAIETARNEMREEK